MGLQQMHHLPDEIALIRRHRIGVMGQPLRSGTVHRRQKMPVTGPHHKFGRRPGRPRFAKPAQDARPRRVHRKNPGSTVSHAKPPWPTERMFCHAAGRL
ncbi:hypothetical protein GCM10008966_12350 [Rhodovulum strictum]